MNTTQDQDTNVAGEDLADEERAHDGVVHDVAPRLVAVEDDKTQRSAVNERRR